MTENIESFSSLLRQTLGDRIDADASSFVEMMAEDGVMEFPYSPAGLPTRLEGRAAIATHLMGLSEIIAFDRMGAAVVHPSTDPNVVIIEFEGFGRGVATGEPYDQRYVSVIRTAGGRIVHYRDYWNPLVVLRATKGAALVDALTTGEGGHA
ncbi:MULTISPECIES: nuclear transport factor 2 family protein [Sphingomonas]|jgi:ketosteroid isomerase-like protein|uniref:nuclear transport factor 2 family protein n=1 Tax=Sphingomonas TaxID=13687 RepID=UPI000AA1CACE|nr:MULTISPECIES: nuclear transport factor 2 family protein [Sphingomonas]MDY0969224.1 nuclear transport factor 2 family protein [Sphingomonas sp. CFBP9021]USR01838.1 nuclear transport factor 2 family protein [Sphingomonas aerolata]